jgi:hypothetical protein
MTTQTVQAVQNVQTVQAVSDRIRLSCSDGWNYLNYWNGWNNDFC